MWRYIFSTCSSSAVSLDDGETADASQTTSCVVPFSEDGDIEEVADDEGDNVMARDYAYRILYSRMMMLKSLAPAPALALAPAPAPASWMSGGPRRNTLLPSYVTRIAKAIYELTPLNAPIATPARRCRATRGGRGGRDGREGGRVEDVREVESMGGVGDMGEKVLKIHVQKAHHFDLYDLRTDASDSW
ncbi:LOW QUALITY PROTEIN: hypothetical protein V2J09_006443 [Rumex salicifolius]